MANWATVPDADDPVDPEEPEEELDEDEAALSMSSCACACARPALATATDNCNWVGSRVAKTAPAWTTSPGLTSTSLTVPGVEKATAVGGAERARADPAERSGEGGLQHVGERGDRRERAFGGRIVGVGCGGGRGAGVAGFTKGGRDGCRGAEGGGRGIPRGAVVVDQCARGQRVAGGAVDGRAVRHRGVQGRRLGCRQPRDRAGHRCGIEQLLGSVERVVPGSGGGDTPRREQRRERLVAAGGEAASERAGV